MIRDHQKGSYTPEYLESICFSIARILEGESVADWDRLAAICDHRYYSLQNGSPPDEIKRLDVEQLEKLYVKYAKYPP